MKKRLIRYISSGLLIGLFHSSSFAQALDPDACPPDPNAPISEYCEDGHGISTNPSNPVNTECPI